MDPCPENCLDTKRLEQWMHDHVEGFEGPLEVQRLKGGQSNLVYRLTTPGHCYVLRRKPPGKLLPSAHAVDREYRVTTALDQNSDVPVAKTYGLCLDEEVVGTIFYIMDYIEGRIFWEPAFPDVPREDRPLYFDAMNEALAKIHNVDAGAIGLGDFGKRGSYFFRQIDRWSKQYLQDEKAGRYDAMDRLVEWLPKNIPQDESISIVHGDYRCDNIIFHPTEPKILAVIDWELSTLGDPLADFTYHLIMYSMPAFPGRNSLMQADLKAMNIPTQQAYIDAYCHRTGRDKIDHLSFYIAYNMFRLAAIVHSIKGRFFRGTAASPDAEAMISSIDPLATRAWEIAQQN